MVPYSRHVPLVIYLHNGTDFCVCLTQTAHYWLTFDLYIMSFVTSERFPKSINPYCLPTIIEVVFTFLINCNEFCDWLEMKTWLKLLLCIKFYFTLASLFTCCYIFPTMYYCPSSSCFVLSFTDILFYFKKHTYEIEIKRI